ncbi:MAG: extracellular solute-binding protein [Spirochaetia bacterium]|nr:extracellular solute-binding protein [Spirochaetia bacterium]MCF7940058.1 extracellular solute-binding protein [Spirochaetia bacterium]
MKNRYRVLIVMIIMCCFVTPVFASGAAEDDGKITIKYNNFSAGETNAAVLQEMIALFEAENPNITIENEAMGYGDNYWTQLVTRIAGNDAPDCFELNMENFLAHATRGSLRPLDSLFADTDLDKSVYSSGLLEAVSFDGELQAIPLMFSTVVLVYNMDLFDRAGVAYPTKDWTWEDSLAAAKKISALGDDTWGMFNPIQFWEFYKVSQQNGGGLMTPDGKTLTINSKANVETLQYMLDRIDVHHVMPSMEELADRPESDLFVEGKLGMWLNGVWAFNDLQLRADFPWGVEVEPGNLSKATHFFGNVGCVSKTTKHPEAAFKFLNFLASNPKAVDLRLDAQWELPTVSDPAIMQRYIADTPPENKIAVVNSLDYAVKPPALEQFAELTNIVNTKIEMAREGLLSAQDALDQAQKEAEAQITL